MVTPSPFEVPRLRPKFMRYRGIVVLAGILCLPLVTRAEKVKNLQPCGYVNDFGGVLNAQIAQQITNICTEVDEKTHAQMAVVTVKTLEGLEASDFANQLFKKWGVGNKGDNRGVLILLATADHKYWTEVGYGLEPILPDGKVGGFGREMVPSLRAGDFNGALLRMTNEIAGVIAADAHVTLSNAGPPPSPATASASGTPQNTPNLTNPQTETDIVILLICGIFVLALVYWVFKAVITFFLASFLWVFGGSRRRARGLLGLWWDALFVAWLSRLLLNSGGSFDGGSFGGGSFGGGGGGSFGGFGGGSSGGGGAGGSW